MIPDEAIEAAAKALFVGHPVSKGAFPWDSHPDGRIKQQFRADARDALVAALPHLSAAAKQPKRTSPTDWPDVPRHQ